jgi:uncharacterized protein with ATP-grasp and redox domains
LPALPQLAAPEEYRACDWDLLTDPQGRAYWLGFFEQHLTTVLKHLRQSYPDAAPGAVERFTADYQALMQEVRAEPEDFAPLDILKLDELRQRLLTTHGFADPFAIDKQRENEAAARLLPDLLDELDDFDESECVLHLARGLLAGNLFDLGAAPTLERYAAGGGGTFLEDRSTLPERPWFEDDLDAWQQRLSDGPPYRHVAFFVDNAGADVCLGCLPLTRYFLRRDVRISLCANTGPALNDVTGYELTLLLAEAVDADPWFADDRLRVIGTGNHAPLIDLSRLSESCLAAVHDADLIILHGMGRAVESNRHARFHCDSLRTAVIKDEAVATHLGAQLFDCSFRFAPAARTGTAG